MSFQGFSIFTIEHRGSLWSAWQTPMFSDVSSRKEGLKDGLQRPIMVGQAIDQPRFLDSWRVGLHDLYLVGGLEHVFFHIII